MRLDIFLAQRGLAASRSRAKALIESSCVRVNGNIVAKAAFDVTEDDKVELENTIKYLSRGGLKLEGAIESFGINVAGKVALDIGASSGGFTDCLLSYGAAEVFAVDAGSGQMAEKLREDKRVHLFENYNARYLSREHFTKQPDIITLDVSFISQTYIIAKAAEVIVPSGDFVSLIKPQFEVGRQRLGKGGIVRNKADREFAVGKVINFALTCGFLHIGTIESPIAGGDGNIEYLAHFKRCV